MPEEARPLRGDDTAKPSPTPRDKRLEDDAVPVRVRSDYPDQAIGQRTLGDTSPADLREVPAIFGTDGRTARSEDRSGGLLHQPRPVRSADQLSQSDHTATDMLKIFEIFNTFRQRVRFQHMCP